MEDIYISKKRQRSVDFEVINLEEPPDFEPPKKKKRKKKHRFLKFVASLLIIAWLNIFIVIGIKP